MKDKIRMTVVLAVVCAISGFVLSRVYSHAKPRIEEKEKQFRQGQAKKVLPEGVTIKEILSEDKGRNIIESRRYYFEGTDSSGRVVSVAYQGWAKGYGGDVVVLVGIDLTTPARQEKITGVGILDQTETPGLGAKVGEIKYREDTPWFTRQYKDAMVSDILASPKDIRQNKLGIQAITAATISSNAVHEAVKAALTTWREESQAR